ncbi:MAG: AbrB/MazE/SpoVT family DNA-binding domain-containing protein [Gemmatimonadota bacterium]
MKITERGQVTIPRELRQKFGFLPDTEVEFIVRDGALELVRKPTHARERVRAIYGRAKLESSTDELMKLLRT